MKTLKYISLTLTYNAIILLSFITSLPCKAQDLSLSSDVKKILIDVKKSDPLNIFSSFDVLETPIPQMYPKPSDCYRQESMEQDARNKLIDSGTLDYKAFLKVTKERDVEFERMINASRDASTYVLTKCNNLCVNIIRLYPELSEISPQTKTKYELGKSGRITFILKEYWIEGKQVLFAGIQVSGKLAILDSSMKYNVDIYSDETPIESVRSFEKGIQLLTKTFYDHFTSARAARFSDK